MCKPKNLLLKLFTFVKFKLIKWPMYIIAIFFLNRRIKIKLKVYILLKLVILLSLYMKIWYKEAFNNHINTNLQGFLYLALELTLIFCIYRWLCTK